MKTALLIGCGSKFGLHLQKTLYDEGWAINSISGTASNNYGNQLIINWEKFTIADLESFLRNQPEIDLLVFNQNSSSLSIDCFYPDSYSTVELWKQGKTWSHTYFASCILPFHIIHSLKQKITLKTKVLWMLSSYVHTHSDITHADYIGNKYQNYLIMKNFSRNFPGCFFGINPTSLNEVYDMQKLLHTINQPVEFLNGKVLFFDGTIDKKFDLFEIKQTTI